MFVPQILAAANEDEREFISAALPFDIAYAVATSTGDQDEPAEEAAGPTMTLKPPREVIRGLRP